VTTVNGSGRVARSDEGRRAVKAKPARRPERWALSAVLLVLLAMLVHMVSTNPRFEWSTVRSYLTTHTILSGLVTTLELTGICMAVGIVLGTLVAIGRLSSNPLVSGCTWLYIWFFRGTPALVQLIFWFNLSSLIPRISFGIPFGPTFATFQTNSLISSLAAAVLGLGLNEAAYMAEIVRGGILSVDEGQSDAAMSLGMTRLTALRRIVLPQAIRVIIPATGNQLIGLLKYTSLVSVLAVQDLLYSAQTIYSQTFQTIPLLLVASIWYLIVTSLLTVGQYYLERYYARGSVRTMPPTPQQRLRLYLGHAMRRRVGVGQEPA
jgi:polar amino acid transport system permease protein